MCVANFEFQAFLFTGHGKAELLVWQIREIMYYVYTNWSEYISGKF